MAQSTHYEYVKLGMNLEYLRGITSSSTLLGTSLVAFPELMENVPVQRFSVPQVVAVLKSLLIQLESMELPQTLAAAADFRPMLAEMETYVARNPAGAATSFLQDHFANQLIRVAKLVALALKLELGSQGG